MLLVQLKFCFMYILNRSEGVKSDASKVETRLSVVTAEPI